VSELASKIGVKSACEVLNVPRSRVYRDRKPKAEPIPRPTPVHALADAEKASIRELLNSERFMDQPPRQIYATLLDEGTYVCHWRTMYRILSAHGEVRERRLIRRHPTYKKPELLAERANEVW
jgi:putative transposase